MGFMDKFKSELKKQFVTKPAEQKQQEEADKAKAKAKQFQSGDVYNNRILDEKNAKALNDGNTLTNAQLETLPKSKADTADTILASNDKDKAEKQKEATNQKIVETTDSQRVYDNTDGDSKQKQEASDKAKDISTPDKAYDTYDTWNEYYEALKKSGKSDDEIMALLKGSRWEKEGSKYDEWKKSKTQTAEPAAEQSAEPKPTAEEPTEPPVEQTEEPPTEDTTGDKGNGEGGKGNGEGDKGNGEPKGDFEGKIDPNSPEGKVLSGETTYPEFLNSKYRSTASAIFDPNSGLSLGERIQMGISVIGKLVGNAMLANGMSLLGDHSYFSKIGEGVSLDNFTTEQQKKMADAIADQQSDMLKDVIANKKVVDSLLTEVKDKKKREIVAGFGHVIATMDDQKRQEFLESKGFTEDEIKAVNNIVPMLKFNSMRSLDKVNKIADVKTNETNQQKNEYEFSKEMFQDVSAIDQKITELESQIRNIKTADTFDNKLKVMETASNIAGAIGQAAKSEGSQISDNSRHHFDIAANASADLNAILGGGKVGVNGSYGYDKSRSKADNESTSETYNQYRAKAIEQYGNAYDSWMKGEGGKMQEAIIKSIKATIEGLKTQKKFIQSKMNDGTIPNGEIEAIQLKNGETIPVNPNDGAILTTNEVPALLHFNEGELNPFDYLGYDGMKHEHEYYEHIFDENRSISSFDEALALLS